MSLSLGGRLCEPSEILEAWGVDLEREGAQAFLELVQRYVAALEQGAPEPYVGRVFQTMAQVRGIYHMALLSSMRAAVRPLLEADADALACCGIYPQKRTPQFMAAALAEAYVS